MLGFCRELWEYARARKKYWLLPLILAMLLMGALIFSSHAALSSPFLYTLF